ncbi:unnamed protein product, partial [marine sediment metagenome]
GNPVISNKSLVQCMAAGLGITPSASPKKEE